jgi:osmotically-inducible protein OsmY
MVDDVTLQAMVFDELTWEPRVDAAHIGVSVHNGVVTLNGFVDNYAAKAAAEQSAGRVRGVKAIADELEVRLPNHQRRADDEIAERAVRILEWNVEVPAGRIHVMVSHGDVTLTGTVDHYFQRYAAENAVRQLSGVRSVINMLTVSRHEGAVQPLLIRQKIEDALGRSAAIEATGIEIDVEGGTVTLKGRVRSWFERSVVRHAAWSAPGVHEVRDQLVIEA